MKDFGNNVTSKGLNEIVTFFPWMLWHSFTKFRTQMHLGWLQGPVDFQGQMSNNYVTRSQDRSNGYRGVKSISILSQYMQSYWFSNQSNIIIIYNISVITITITMSIILANFGKYAFSDCPFMFYVSHCTDVFKEWSRESSCSMLVTALMCSLSCYFGPSYSDNQSSYCHLLMGSRIITLTQDLE